MFIFLVSQYGLIIPRSIFVPFGETVNKIGNDNDDKYATYLPIKESNRINNDVRIIQTDLMCMCHAKE